ncbi:MAG: ABC transporter ATP-binding protein [Cyclobacteriaceae bacterium]
MSDIAIKVEDLWKQYRIGHKKSTSFRESINHWFSKSEEDYFWALKELNFEVKRGEAIGIIGKNGAGKSTLLKVLSKITYPTKGRVTINGRVSSLLEVGTGFHPELSGRQNVYLNGTILGMTKKEIASKFDEIVAFSGVEKFIDTPVKHYSSGMKVRLAFSVAAHLEPEILIIDEVLAVGDAEFQKKCLGKMEDVAGEGRTVLFVSHNMGAVNHLCKHGIVLNQGSVQTNGTIEKAVSNYMSSNQKLARIDILERTDREGHGLLRIQKVNILDEKNQRIDEVSCGMSFSLKFEIKEFSPVDYSKVIIGISISDHSQNHVALHHSRLNGTLFSGQGIYTLEFHKLSLMPGLYFLTFSVQIDGIYADRLQDAMELNVIPGAYYETLEIPPVGKVLLDAKWRYEGNLEKAI